MLTPLQPTFSLRQVPSIRPRFAANDSATPIDPAATTVALVNAGSPLLPSAPGKTWRQPSLFPDLDEELATSTTGLIPSLPEQPHVVMADMLHMLGRMSVALGGTEFVYSDPHPLIKDGVNLMDRLTHVLHVLQGQALSAEVDGLTGIKNRAFFDVTLVQLFRQAASKKTPLSLMMIDMDKFKQINDDTARGGGHQVGDEVLKLLAREMAHSVRLGEGELCRYGGEEFALILPNCEPEKAQRLASRLLNRLPELSRLHREDGSRNPTLHELCKHRDFSVSIGVATLSPGIVTAHHLVKLADLAAILAKEKGRNRVVVATLDRPDEPVVWENPNTPQGVRFSVAESGPLLKWDYDKVMPDFTHTVVA